MHVIKRSLPLFCHQCQLQPLILLPLYYSQLLSPFSVHKDCIYSHSTTILFLEQQQVKRNKMLIRSIYVQEKPNNIQT